MKWIDLTLPLDAADWQSVVEKRSITAFGHIGTHIDIRGKEFPIEYCVRPGRTFDVRNVLDREIDISDLAADVIEPGDCVLFFTGFSSEKSYGSDEYSENHPELSRELVRLLVERNVSLIGIDAAGIRRGKEHAQTDQFCAEHGVFVIENLVHLELLWNERANGMVTVYTFPLALKGSTGLPCRIVAAL